MTDNIKPDSVATLNLQLKVVLFYGKMLLENNYAVLDVREKINELLDYMGLTYFSIFMTQTGLVLINTETNEVKMINATRTSYNFEKIGKIEAVLKSYYANDMTTDALYNELKQIDKNSYSFSIVFQMISAGVICASMFVIIGGLSSQAIIAFLVGTLAYYLYLILDRYIDVQIFSVFVVSCFISLTAKFLFTHHIMSSEFSLFLSCIMPFLPGASMVNSIRSSIQGDYITGLAQGISTINTAIMLTLPFIYLL